MRYIARRYSCMSGEYGPDNMSAPLLTREDAQATIDAHIATLPECCKGDRWEVAEVADCTVTMPADETEHNAAQFPTFAHLFPRMREFVAHQYKVPAYSVVMLTMKELPITHSDRICSGYRTYAGGWQAETHYSHVVSFRYSCSWETLIGITPNGEFHVWAD